MEQNDELLHYGVIGMKWGIKKAGSKINSTDKLNRKIKKYEVRAAKREKTAEKIHAKWDIGAANRKATRAAKLRKKSAKLTYKATNEDNELARSILEKRAAKLKYKAAKKDISAHRISKSKGYGKLSMFFSVRSDKAKAKAEKAKLRIASNKVYVEKMNRKLSSITPEERAKVQSYVDKYLN